MYLVEQRKAMRRVEKETRIYWGVAIMCRNVEGTKRLNLNDLSEVRVDKRLSWWGSAPQASS